MVAGKYDIFAEQGSDFKLFMEYKTSGETAINMSGWTADMQIRLYKDDTNIVAHFTGNSSISYFYSGGSTGYFITGNGITGVGGILLNSDSIGETGSSGTTGGIFIYADSDVTPYIPVGRHFYDLLITTPTEKIRLIEGTFDISGDVTR